MADPRRKLPGAYPQQAELKHLLPKRNPLSRALRKEPGRVLCYELGLFLRVSRGDIRQLAEKLGAVKVLWVRKNRQYTVSWLAAEKIIMLVRARQGKLALKRGEHAIPVPARRG